MEINFSITWLIFLSMPHMKAFLTINQPISRSHRSVIRKPIEQKSLLALNQGSRMVFNAPRKQFNIIVAISFVILRITNIYS